MHSICVPWGLVHALAQNGTEVARLEDIAQETPVDGVV